MSQTGRLFNQAVISLLDNELHFAEFELYTEGGVNIALLGTASQNTTSFSGAASRGNDGNTDPTFQGNSVTHTAFGGIWTLDFDQNYTYENLNRVVLYNRVEVDNTIPEIRLIGAEISLHSADGLDPLIVGICTSDAVQTFVLKVVPFTPTPRVTTIPVTLGVVSGAIAYRLTIQKTGSSIERVSHTDFTELDVVILNVLPETEYTIRLYSTDGNGYTIVGESVTTTLVNSAPNYDKSDFLETSGRYNISSLDTETVGLMSDFMDVFTTDDAIDINVSGKTLISKFINRGGSTTIEDSDALVVPFSTIAGSGQAVSLTLSDTSTISVTYDEITEAVTLNSTAYGTGESFVLDGKKVTIVDI